MFVHGFSSLVLSDGGGVSTVGDAASIVRLIAGIFGVVFLAVVVLQITVSWRTTRDDEQLNVTVETLKKRAGKQDAYLREHVKVSTDEALNRLQKLGLVGMAFFVSYIAVPPEFRDDT